MQLFHNSKLKNYLIAHVRFLSNNDPHTHRNLTVTSTPHMCARPLHGVCSVLRYKSGAQPPSEQQVTQVKPRSSGHAICCRCVYHRLSYAGHMNTYSMRSRKSFKKLNSFWIQWFCARLSCRQTFYVDKASFYSDCV